MSEWLKSLCVWLRNAGTSSRGRAGEALVVADHGADRDVEATAKPADEPQAGGHLASVIEDLQAWPDGSTKM